MRLTHRQSVNSMVHFFVGVAELLLLLRVALRFFNGNPNATFIHWAYTNTNVLLQPLRGIFPGYAVVNRGWVVDYVAILAMVAYAAFGFILIAFMAGWANWAAKKR